MIRQRTSTIALCVVALLFTSHGAALAQAGSLGGIVGNQDKTISGETATDSRRAPSDERARRSPLAKRDAVSTATQEKKPQAAGCPSVVGLWNSWASFVFGKADTTFDRDGTWVHKSGQGGKWWCEGGEFRIQKPGQGVERYRLSPDGKQIISLEANAGAVVFSRD
jgi:hypothetical protein